ncbi:UNVERIFIED_CONTAM: hypothetical protein NCL1_28754 [Trichonephila clavipes]
MNILEDLEVSNGISLTMVKIKTEIGCGSWGRIERNVSFPFNSSELPSLRGKRRPFSVSPLSEENGSRLCLVLARLV